MQLIRGRLQAVLMFLLAIFLIAGCFGGNAGSASHESKPAGGTTNTANNSNQEEKTAAGEPEEITLLFAESLFGGIHNDLVKEFEASHPEIKVKIESLPEAGIYDALRVRISTGEMPDLFQINIGHVTTQMANEAGYIYDLKDMESLQAYAPSVVEASKIDGKIANFSLGVGVLGFPYNKAMLAEVGYTEPFKTWEEMMDAGSKLKAQGKDLLVYSSKWETGIGNVFHWTFASKGLEDPEFMEAYLSNSIDWTKPGYRDVLAEGFQRFAELNQYVRIGSFTNEYAIAQQSFTNEESAMILGGTWEAGSIRSLNPDLDLGFMNLPYTEASKNPYIFVPEDGIAVNAKSEKLEGAKTFVNWLFSKEVYAQIQKAKGSMSAITGVGELDPSYEDVPNWLATDRVVSFANTGPIPGPTWIALGEAAQQYTFDNDLESAINRFIDTYHASKSQ